MSVHPLLLDVGAAVCVTVGPPLSRVGGAGRERELNVTDIEPELDSDEGEDVLDGGKMVLESAVGLGSLVRPSVEALAKKSRVRLGVLVQSNTLKPSKLSPEYRSFTQYGYAALALQR